MVNTAIIYDKHGVIQRQQKRGFSHDQTEGIAEVLSDTDLSQLVTKFDLERALHRQTWGLIGVMFAQCAFIIAALQLLS